MYNRLINKYPDEVHRESYVKYAEGVILSGAARHDRLTEGTLENLRFECRRCKAKAESLRQKDRALFPARGISF